MLKSARRFWAWLLLVGLIPAASLGDQPADELAFLDWCGTCKPAFVPKRALCLRLQDGYLRWNEITIKEEAYDSYIPRLLNETKLRVIAVFPDHETKLGDLARIITALSKLEADRVVFTPPLSDDTFKRVTKGAK